MRPGWVAGSTRARLLLGRTIGVEHARTIAASPSLGDGLAALAGSAYGERVGVDEDLAAAERGVAETLVWHLRILAGWLPAAGVRLVRALAGWLELQNIDARLAALAGAGVEPSPLTLGGLATAWPAVARARGLQEIAQAVSASAWGHTQARSVPQLAIELRVAWARRVQEIAPGARAWVGGASALLLARELFLVDSREHIDELRRLPEIDARALAAGSLAELPAALPARGRWVLEDVDEPSELWRAELRWWDRVRRDADALIGGVAGGSVVLGAVALLAADAERTRRALAAAACGGVGQLGEAIDGVA